MAPDVPPPIPQAETSTQRTPDRISAVLGNATLLGIGYLLMRRPRTAIVSLLGSIALLALVAVFPHMLVWRLLLALWWAALVLHTWRSASRASGERPGPRGGRNPVWRDRVLTAVCLVLVTPAWLLLDTWAIARDAAAAHAGGDCDRAVGSLRWLGAAHGLVDGSATARGQEEREACELLLAALDASDSAAGAEQLGAYLEHPGALWDGAGPKRAELLLDEVLRSDPDPREQEVPDAGDPAPATVDEAFTQLSATLEDTPGESRRVRAVAESFLADLADVPPCKATAIDSVLHARTWQSPALAEPMASAADQVPVRKFDCAEALTATNPEAAGPVYQDLVQTHPEHELAADATEGLLAGGAYCDHPAAYPDAPAYKGAGPHAMRTLGMDPDEYGFPDSWRAGAVAETVLVTCVEGPDKGGYQQTCHYDPGADQLLSPFQQSAKVDFYASRFTVKAYSLKTGEPVADYSAEIGDPCPAVLEYETSPYLDIVPGEYESDFTDAEARSIFDRLMD
ncbi:hypothetical protein FZ103_09750 [Streptomonospora sp. PA3]|uniref:hypothetical protein n=1 Tax=Streptomonospora sp. PA3 TaxID=2607326 RepID=UPI0012DE258B|nr:hypothetical protein [Streptomonospora sp. PA3]MUL41454.1 hypothetical protein [Streptomonospora sp. PA3]